jgi:hypothetical protein
VGARSDPILKDLDFMIRQFAVWRHFYVWIVVVNGFNEEALFWIGWNESGT